MKYIQKLFNFTFLAIILSVTVLGFTKISPASAIVCPGDTINVHWNISNAQPSECSGEAPAGYTPLNINSTESYVPYTVLSTGGEFAVSCSNSGGSAYSETSILMNQPDFCSSPCPVGQILSSNGCTNIVCPTGEMLVGNNCTPIPCPVGETLSGNTCVALNCPTGEQISGNSCVPIVCGTNQTLVGSTCVTNPCPVGQKMVSGSCSPIICPTGQKLNGNDCEPIICADDEYLSGNNCLALICTSIQYAANHKCNDAEDATISASLDEAPAAPPYINTVVAEINYSCSLPSDNYVITRSTLPNTVSSGNISGLSTSNLTEYGYATNQITLTSAVQTITYTLECYKGSNLVDQKTFDLNVPAKIFVNPTPSKPLTTGSDATLNWTSNGNICLVWTRDTVPVQIYHNHASPKTGSGPHNYSVALPSSEHACLKTKGVYGYDIVCYDTDNTRPAQTNFTILTVYSKPKASLENANTGTPGEVRVQCDAPDWTKASLYDTENESVPLKVWTPTAANKNTGLPGTFFTVNPNIKSLKLICENAYDHDTATLPKSSFTLSATVRGDTSSPLVTATVDDPVSGNSKTETINVTSSNGIFSSVSYQVSGATSYSVLFADNSSGTGLAQNSDMNFTSGTSSKSFLSFGPFTSGAYIRVIATGPSGITKTLNIILQSNIQTTAIIDPGTDYKHINFTCNNATSYEVLIDGVLKYSGTISSDSFSTSINHLMGAGKINEVVTLICKNSSNSETKNTTITNPSLSAATIQKLNIYPTEQVCNGGPITLSWETKNSATKDCKFTAQNISTAPDSAAYLTSTLLPSINNATYKTLPDNITRTATAAFDTQDTNGISRGQVTGLNVKYSTRFILTCGGTGAVPLSSKSVDIKVVCVGQQ